MSYRVLARYRRFRDACCTHLKSLKIQNVLSSEISVYANELTRHRSRDESPIEAFEPQVFVAGAVTTDGNILT